MFKNNESPISLFSFQDIITSLTGIMIFFLLLLVLNILEIISQKADFSAVEKELDLMRKKNEIHQKHIKEIQNDIDTFRARIKSAREKDESMLIIEQFNLKKQLNEQKKYYKKLKQDLANKGNLLHHAEKKNKELLDELRKKDELLAQNDVLSRQNEKKEQQIKRIRNTIKQKRSSVAVTIDKTMKKTPLLIECSSSKISVYDSESHLKNVFKRQEPVVAPLITNVIQYLQTRPVNKYYFIFLVKPSAVQYLNYLINCFQTKIQHATWGKEPIYEREGIANE